MDFLNQFVLEGIHCEFDSITRFRLGENIGHVACDSIEADKQFISNLRIILAEDDQAKYFLLARGEWSMSLRDGSDSRNDHRFSLLN